MAQPFFTNEALRAKLSAAGIDPDDPQIVQAIADNAPHMLGPQPSTGVGGMAAALGSGIWRGGVVNPLRGLADLAQVFGPRPALGPSPVEQVNPISSGVGQAIGFIASMMMGAGAVSKLGKIGAVAEEGGQALNAFGRLMEAGETTGSGLLSGLSRKEILARAVHMGATGGLVGGLTTSGSIEERLSAAAEGTAWGAVFGAAGAPPGLSRGQAFIREGIAGALGPTPVANTGLPWPLPGAIMGGGMGALFAHPTPRSEPKPGEPRGVPSEPLPTGTGPVQGSLSFVKDDATRTRMNALLSQSIQKMQELRDSGQATAEQISGAVTQGDQVLNPQTPKPAPIPEFDPVDARQAMLPFELPTRPEQAVSEAPPEPGAPQPVPLFTTPQGVQIVLPHVTGLLEQHLQRRYATDYSGPADYKTAMANLVTVLGKIPRSFLDQYHQRMGTPFRVFVSPELSGGLADLNIGAVGLPARQLVEAPQTVPATILHELAHVISGEPATPEQQAALAGRAIRPSDVLAGRGTVTEERAGYAQTVPAERIPVLTEAYFNDPIGFRQEAPQSYSYLDQYYRNALGRGLDEFGWAIPDKTGQFPLPFGDMAEQSDFVRQFRSDGQPSSLEFLGNQERKDLAVARATGDMATASGIVDVATRRLQDAVTSRRTPRSPGEIRATLERLQQAEDESFIEQLAKLKLPGTEAPKAEETAPPSPTGKPYKGAPKSERVRGTKVTAHPATKGAPVGKLKDVEGMVFPTFKVLEDEKGQLFIATRIGRTKNYNKPTPWTASDNGALAHESYNKEARAMIRRRGGSEKVVEEALNQLTTDPKSRFGKALAAWGGNGLPFGKSLTYDAASDIGRIDEILNNIRLGGKGATPPLTTAKNRSIRAVVHAALDHWVATNDGSLGASVRDIYNLVDRGVVFVKDPLTGGKASGGHVAKFPEGTDPAFVQQFLEERKAELRQATGKSEIPETTERPDTAQNNMARIMDETTLAAEAIPTSDVRTPEEHRALVAAQARSLDAEKGDPAELAPATPPALPVDQLPASKAPEAEQLGLNAQAVEAARGALEAARQAKDPAPKLSAFKSLLDQGFTQDDAQKAILSLEKAQPKAKKAAKTPEQIAAEATAAQRFKDEKLAHQRKVAEILAYKIKAAKTDAKLKSVLREARANRQAWERQQAELEAKATAKFNKERAQQLPRLKELTKQITRLTNQLEYQRTQLVNLKSQGAIDNALRRVTDLHENISTALNKATQEWNRLHTLELLREGEFIDQLAAMRMEASRAAELVEAARTRSTEFLAQQSAEAMRLVGMANVPREIKQRFTFQGALDHVIARFASPENREQSETGTRRMLKNAAFLAEKAKEAQVSKLYPAIMELAKARNLTEAHTALTKHVETAFGQTESGRPIAKYDFAPVNDKMYFIFDAPSGERYFFDSPGQAALWLDLYKQTLTLQPDYAPPGTFDTALHDIEPPRAPEVNERLADGEGGDKVPPGPRGILRELNWFDQVLAAAEPTVAKIERTFEKQFGKSLGLEKIWQDAVRGYNISRRMTTDAIQEASELAKKHGIKPNDVMTSWRLGRAARAIDNASWQIQTKLGQRAAESALPTLRVQLGQRYRLTNRQIMFLTEMDGWWQKRFKDFGLTRDQVVGFYTRMRMKARGLEGGTVAGGSVADFDFNRWWASEKRSWDGKPINAEDLLSPEYVAELKKLGINEAGDNYFETLATYARTGYRKTHMAPHTTRLESLLQRADPKTGDMPMFAKGVTTFIERQIQRLQGMPTPQDKLANSRRTAFQLTMAKHMKSFTDLLPAKTPDVIVDGLTNMYQRLGVKAATGQVRGMMDTFTGAHRSMVFGLHVMRATRDATTTLVMNLYPRFAGSGEYASALLEVMNPKIYAKLAARYLKSHWIEPEAFAELSGESFKGAFATLADRSQFLYRKTDTFIRVAASRMAERATEKAIKEYQQKPDFARFLSTTGLDTYQATATQGFREQLKAQLDRGNYPDVIQQSVQLHQGGSVFNFTRPFAPGYHDSPVGRFLGQYGSWSANEVSALSWLVRGPLAVHGNTPYAWKRVAAITAKYALAAEATYALGAAFNIDTSDWIPFVHNVWYTGGPGLSLLERTRDILGGDPEIGARLKRDPNAVFQDWLRRAIPIPAGDIVRRVLSQWFQPDIDQTTKRVLSLPQVRESLWDKWAVTFGFMPFQTGLTHYKPGYVSSAVTAIPHAIQDTVAEATGLPPGSREKAAEFEPMFGGRSGMKSLSVAGTP